MYSIDYKAAGLPSMLERREDLGLSMLKNDGDSEIFFFIDMRTRLK